jgi:hypothetical protein
VQPRSNPRLGLVLPNLEHAVRRRGLHPNTPPGDERVREGGIREGVMAENGCRPSSTKAVKAAHLRQIGPSPQPGAPEKRQKPLEVSHRGTRSRIDD